MESEYRNIVKTEHKTALRQWHSDLQNNRGLRASLRHATTLSDACLADGFRGLLMTTHSLWKITDQPWRFTALAMVAALGAHVKTIVEGQSFAAQLGNQKGGGNAVMTALRFKRLSAAKTPDDLLRQLRRAIHLLDGKVNLPSLAEDLFRWCREADDRTRHYRRPQDQTEFIRVRWAMDYYQAGNPDDDNHSADAE